MKGVAKEQVKKIYLIKKKLTCENEVDDVQKEFT